MSGANQLIRTRVTRWAFDQRILGKLPRVVALGDSHVSVVEEAVRLSLLKAQVDTCVVPGATAQGLHNPNSRTDALRRFADRCGAARNWQTLAFLLGEVDCGFVIWYRAEKYGVSVESQLDRSLSAYRSLLIKQTRRQFVPLVLSVPLPTISDGQEWGEVANARREIRATQKERTDLTLSYNQRLRGVCEEIGAKFLDVTTAMLDRRTGVIRPEYLNPDPTDHHLHPYMYAALVAPAIGSAIGSR